MPRNLVAIRKLRGGTKQFQAANHPAFGGVRMLGGTSRLITSQSQIQPVQVFAPDRRRD
jgi:hypothetical protein